LLAQGDVLEGQLTVAADEEGAAAEQVQERGDHGSTMFAEPTVENQSRVDRTELWRRTSAR
jgi:hypothetical protein